MINRAHAFACFHERGFGEVSANNCFALVAEESFNVYANAFAELFGYPLQSGQRCGAPGQFRGCGLARRPKVFDKGLNVFGQDQGCRVPAGRFFGPE